jgi:NADH-quinone oxidoreductase subunit G
MATIYIENKPYEVKDGQNLLQACLSLGFDIPYFCWHPALESVGACRLCAVKQFKDANDTTGRIVMSCMTPAADGVRISIDDPAVMAFRAQVIEWLMTNHPHDCPVCDEGGECHLQDMTVMTGHTCRNSRFPKRTYVNQNLGPFLNHEMNRCIQCYRCVRFYRDYAGGRDFGPFASHNHVYFGRHEDGALENEFSGNLCEVCPTGVFTCKPIKKCYTRSWDLATAPSVCAHCGLGCNTLPGERYGEIRRVRNRYNHAVNGYFICDRGRFGYEFINGPTRVREAIRRCDGQTEIMDEDKARDFTASLLKSAKGVVGIGSPRASVESNFALRELVGEDRFSLGIPEGERALLNAIVDILRTGPAPAATLGEMAQCDAVLVLGEDVTNAAPMIALQLRQSVRRAPMAIAAKLRIPEWDDAAVREAVQDEKGPLFVATPAADKLDEIATQTFRAAPDDIARLGFAVANAIDPASPAVADLDDATRALAAQIAAALQGANKPLVVSGPSLGSAAIIQAAANVAWALCAQDKPARIAYVAPECNSIGATLLGGKSLEDAFSAVASGEADTVIVVENDLYRRANHSAVDALFATAKHVIVLDHTETATASKAEVVLPAGTYAESDGNFVNNEGRAQRFIKVFPPKAPVRESWRWLDSLRAAVSGAAPAWPVIGDLLTSLADSVAALADVRDSAPAASARFLGQKVPRLPHRATGRTAMLANISVHEPKIAEDGDSPMSFSMEGFSGDIPPALVARYWTPGWNSVQGLTKFQDEVAGQLHGGDPGVALLKAPGGSAPYFAAVPAAFAAASSQRLFVPMQHIFGSEELSVLAPAVAERVGGAYVAVNAADASALGLQDGDMAEVSIGEAGYRVPVRIAAAMPSGVAGLPAGLTGVAVLPAWGTVAKGMES